MKLRQKHPRKHILLKLLCSTALLSSLSAPALAANADYPDVPADHWARQSLETLAQEYGVVLGYPDGSFQGDRKVSRYEMAALILKLMRMHDANPEQAKMLEALKAEFAAELKTLADKNDAELENILDRLDMVEVNQMEQTEQFTTWLDQNLPVRLSGNVGLRYEHKATDLLDPSTSISSTPQTRVTLSLDSRDEGQPFLYGTRLTVGNLRNPSNSWWRLGDFFGRVEFNLDRFFITWRPASWLDLTAGKFKNIYSNSELFMDFDVQPEGSFQRLHFENLTPGWSSLAFTLGETVLNMNPLYQGNAFMLSAKGDTRFSFGSAVDLDLSAAYHQFVQENVLYDANQIANDNKQAARVVGNAQHNTAGTQFGIANAFARLTWNITPELPLSLSGDYLYNVAASDLNQGLQAGISLGSTRRPGDWELAYLFKYLEADASLSYFVEDQLGGTDVMAQEGQVAVKVWDKTTLFGTYQYATRLSGSDTPRHTLRIGINQAF